MNTLMGFPAVHAFEKRYGLSDRQAPMSAAAK
jgi:hypothetical protein